MTKSRFEDVKPIVVGRELRSGKRGLVAVFETHTAPLDNYHVLAQLLIEFDLTPLGLPDEEGWESMVDLTDEEWGRVRTVYRSMQSTRYL